MVSFRQKYTYRPIASEVITPLLVGLLAALITRTIPSKTTNEEPCSPPSKQEGSKMSRRYIRNRTLKSLAYVLGPLLHYPHYQVPCLSPKWNGLHEGAWHSQRQKSTLVQTMVWMIERAHTLAEAAGASPLAAAYHLRDELQGKKVGIVCSGGNTSLEHLRRALALSLL